jgi:glycosyltransferase involved in cell wall biosynthesis
VNAPKASVIIPAFNCEAYIADCLNSVTAQTEPDIEIIVVDDGSTDGTLDVAKQTASTDPRVSVYTQPHSGFPGVARNVGLARATARYVSFLDGDDLYHPEKIKRSLEAFTRLDGIEIVFHDYKRFTTRLADSQTFLESTHFTQRAAPWLNYTGEKAYLCRREFYNFTSLEFVPCHVSSTMLRRDLLPPASRWFREDLRNGEDGDFWLRVIPNRRIAFINEALSYYRVRPQSLSSDPIRHLLGAIQLQNENLARGREAFTPSEVRRYKAKIAALYLDLGYQYFCRFDADDARGAYRQSMKTAFRTKTLAAYVKTFAPAFLVRMYRRWRYE